MYKRPCGKGKEITNALLCGCVKAASVKRPARNAQSELIQKQGASSKKNENSQMATIVMKRKCKNIDITDRTYIEKMIFMCMDNKASKAWFRSDVRNFWAGKSIVDVVEELHHELVTRTVNFPSPIKRERVDIPNGKIRIITIEHIKQQYYDYIAYHGLDELASRIGEYQFACQPGKGPTLGSKVIKGWLQDPTIKYAIKADIKQCYPSVTHTNMMTWLRKRVKNDTLLYLVEVLLNSVEEGLPIGSYLSIRLCALYLSDLYHHIGGGYFKERRGKRQNIIKHVMFFLDDIYIFGSNARDMNKAMGGIILFANSMGLEIKPQWTVINFNPKDPNCHIDAMGYRIYRDHITMRRRDYVRAKRALRRFRRKPTIENARSFTAYHGLFIKNTDSFRFRKKYNVKKLFRKARNVISKYDKGNLSGTSGTGNGHRSSKRRKTVSAGNKRSGDLPY